MIPRHGDAYHIDDVNAFIDEGVVESERLDYKVDPHIFGNAQVAPITNIRAMVAKAVGAFGNSGGGTLLLGVNEGPNGEPVRTNPAGYPSQLNGMAAVEAIDRMITRHTIPRVPAVVRHALIAGTDRGYLIVDVPPRGAGPYRVVGLGDPGLDERYFVRQGRSSVIADHYQLRQLFAEAAAGEAQVREYLAQRGFPSDIYDGSFGGRSPAITLRSSDDGADWGAVVVTVVPDVLRGDVIATEDAGVQALLDPGAHEEVGAFGYERKPILEGRAVQDTHDQPQFLNSYLHVHRNGYIEAGHGRAIAAGDPNKWVLADAVQVVLQSVFWVARRLYAHAGIQDRALVAIHIRGASGSRLGALIGGGEIDGSGNCPTPNLTVAATLTLDELGLAKTRAFLDERLANAYGIEGGLILNADGTDRARRHFP